MIEVELKRLLRQLNPLIVTIPRTQIDFVLIAPIVGRTGLKQQSSDEERFHEVLEGTKRKIRSKLTQQGLTFLNL